MKPPTKIAVVGCGGITCALAPHLALDYNLVLIDGDKFEARNCTRQFPAMRDHAIESNKAEWLASYLRANFPERTITSIPQYLQGPGILNHPEMAMVDFVFCAVDNNQSRRLVCHVCDIRDIPAILMGNETESADAHLFLPGRFNPMEVHDFGPMTKAPFACTSDDNPASEQTSRANFMAAALGVHIFGSYLRAEKWNSIVVHSTIDTRSDSSRRRLIDFHE